MEMEVTTSSNKKADTNYSSSRWWLELDEEKPRDQDDQTMETDDSSKTEPSLADPFFGLFGDCSSYTNLKRQNKIGLFGLFPLNWRPEDACADGGYWLYSDQQMESTLQAAREALGNAKSTVYKSVYSARGSALLDRLVYHSPNSSPVLEACARLELEQGNWAKAEGLLRSLMQIQPGNEWAKSQRLSILPKVDAEDDERLSLLDSLREQLLAKQLTDRAKVVAYSSSPSPINSSKYEAYIRAMIYHTVAIEGNQMKPEEMEAVLKLIPTAAAGQNADDANAMAAAATAIVPREWRRKARDIAEVLAMRQVMEKIGAGRQNGSSSTAYTGRPALEELSLEYLLDLHRLVLRNAPKYAGKLRQCNVRITNVPFQMPEWFLVKQQNHQQQIGDADNDGEVMPISVPEQKQQQQQLVQEEGTAGQHEQSAQLAKEEQETSCDIHSNEPLHALMDRICELCHDMYSHQRPNMRADCRSDCFRNVDFKRCLRLFRPMASSNRQSAAGRGFRHWAAATMDTTLIF